MKRAETEEPIYEVQLTGHTESLFMKVGEYGDDLMVLCFRRKPAGSMGLWRLPGLVAET